MTASCSTRDPAPGSGHRRRMEALARRAGRPRARVRARRSRSGARQRRPAGDVVVVDSYRVRADDRTFARARCRRRPIDDLARDLAVDLVVDPSPGALGAAHRRARRVLAGAAYALVPAARRRRDRRAASTHRSNGCSSRPAPPTPAVSAREIAASALAAACPRSRSGSSSGPGARRDVPRRRRAGARARRARRRDRGRRSIVVTAGGVTLLEACRARPPDRRARAGRQPAPGGVRPRAGRRGGRRDARDRRSRTGCAASRRATGAAASRWRRRASASIDGKGAIAGRRRDRTAGRADEPRGRSSLCVVQARTGSTRLPGKVLQDLGGRPLLRFMLDRLADLRVDELVVATSTLDRDDAVADIARDAGRQVVRGSEADVLGRFVDRARRASRRSRDAAHRRLPARRSGARSRRCSPAISIGAPTTRRTCSRARSRAASTAR